MYGKTPINPHRTRAGSAEKAGPSGRKSQQTTDSPGKVIGANRRPTSTITQPLDIEHPRMKQRVRTGGTNPPLKTFRITHLNCANSREALDELVLIRQREDILITTETLLLDNIPPEIEGYTKIHAEYDSENDTKPRVCTYIRDSSLGYTTHHMCTATENRLRIDNRLLRGIYSPPHRTPSHVYDSMEDGEIRMGDFNAAHPRWFKTDVRTTEGTRLTRWMDDEGARERGPEEATHDKGHKLDLIFTRDNPDNETTIYHNGRVEHSDHRCQSFSFKVKRTIQTFKDKTDYRKTNPKDIEDLIKAQNYPDPGDAAELGTQLEAIISQLPKKKVRERIQKPLIVLEKRRTLNRAIRSKKAGKKEIQTLRLEYREAIRKHGNDRITQGIDTSQEHEKFFKLSKRGTTKKAIPPMTDGDKRYETHAEISEHLANHHGQGNPTPENPKPTTDIDQVTYGEVMDAINKAPTNSTIGTDDVGIPLLRGYHRAKPLALGRIYTDVLRSGKHPSDWKIATVVPIPKANKPRYDHPKSWRSLHLLSLVSKTLERIVLSRLQDYGENMDTLGPTQFGSRRNTGASDANTILRDWLKQSTDEGYHTACILTDVEGGFDKVDPEVIRKGNTDIDGRYREWIYNWTQNRRINFRFNGQTDGRMFITNRGLPQGSPLSPYLFGGYVKQIVSEDTRFLQNVFIISYVDDILICIRGKDQEELEEIGRAAWQRINERANEAGMTFAENKTKTWTTSGSWTIGTRIKELRFLGYWYTAGTTKTEKHTKHWLTKANFAYNQLRALTQRYEDGKGLNTLSTIRLLHSTTKAIGTYGIEHSDETDLKSIDSFMYEAVRRLFDMPLNTPHRAISAEFAITPTKIQRDYIVARIKQRHQKFPDIMRKARELGRIRGGDDDGEGGTENPEGNLPWHVDIPVPPIETPITALEKDTPVHVGHLLTMTGSTGSITYTDGSEHPQKGSSYGLVHLDYRGHITHQDKGRLSKGKTILDAEITAIYKAMEHILNNRISSPLISKHFILTDSTAALHAVTNPSRRGATAYFNAWRHEIETHTMRKVTHFLIGKVKAHSGVAGNEMADKLAKTADTYKDPYPGTSMSKITSDTSKLRQKRWDEWYNLQKH